MSSLGSVSGVFTGRILVRQLLLKETHPFRKTLRSLISNIHTSEFLFFAWGNGLALGFQNIDTKIILIRKHTHFTTEVTSVHLHCSEAPVSPHQNWCWSSDVCLCCLKKYHLFTSSPAYSFMWFIAKCDLYTNIPDCILTRKLMN